MRVPWFAQRSGATTLFVRLHAGIIPTMGPSRIHRKSWDNDWDVHCLTFSTFRRQPFFPGRHASDWFLQALAAARKRCPFHLFAYVIMPEHVHLVCQPLPGVRVQNVLWHIKRPVTTAAMAWVKAHRPDFLPSMADVQPCGKVVHRFWQRGGGYDRNLRSTSDVHEKIAYIHDNPVRRGLVKNAKDWRYSSAGDWILQKTGPVPIDWDNVPQPELR